MTSEQLIQVGLILFLGSVLQGAVGFAYSLFAVPILFWLGISLSQIVALMSIAGATQVVVAVYQLRAEVKWKRGISAALMRISTIPIGVYLLMELDTLQTRYVKQILGILLLIFLLGHLFWKVKPQERIHPVWTVLALSSSGILQGMVAMGGPPVVLWVMAHRWSSQEMRAFLFSQFLFSTPVQLLVLYLSFGQTILYPMMGGVIFIPVVAVGSSLGVVLGNFIGISHLRQATLGILFFIAFSSILYPM